MPFYLALLRPGFTEPAWSPRPLVVSYTTVSPSPVPVENTHMAIGGLFSVALSRGHPRWDFPSGLPCGVRTFLRGTLERVSLRDHLALSPFGARVTAPSAIVYHIVSPVWAECFTLVNPQNSSASRADPPMDEECEKAKGENQK